MCTYLHLGNHQNTPFVLVRPNFCCEYVLFFRIASLWQGLGWLLSLFRTPCRSCCFSFTLSFTVYLAGLLKLVCWSLASPLWPSVSISVCDLSQDRALQVFTDFIRWYVAGGPHGLDSCGHIQLSGGLLRQTIFYLSSPTLPSFACPHVQSLL